MQNNEIISVTHQQWLFQDMSIPVILSSPFPIIPTTLVILTTPVILSEAKNLPLAHHHLHPMQRHIHKQRRKHTTLRNPSFAGEVSMTIHHSRRQPGVDGLPERRKGLQPIQDDCLVQVVECSFNISIEYKT